MEDTSNKVDSTRKRGRVLLALWLVSIVLVIIGIILIIHALHGPRVGPNLPAPIGRTSMSSTEGLSSSQNGSRWANSTSELPRVELATTFEKSGGSAIALRPRVHYLSSPNTTAT
jgi:hypothetical protein